MRLIKNLSIGFASLLVVGGVYGLVEPMVTNAQATDAVNVNLSVTTGIAITSPSDLTMSALTTSQNTSAPTSGVTWTVTTNNATGYTLALKAGSAPALARSGGSGNIVDYTPAVTDTPETWSVSSAAEFGFSAFGGDVPTATWGTDTDCIAGTNVPSAGLKWTNFKTSDVQVASNSAPTSTSGTASTMCVAAEQAGIFAKSGTYQAVITATATTNP